MNTKEVIICNGEEIYYDIVNDEICYWNKDGKRLSCVDETKFETIKTKGIKMTYEQTMKTYGLSQDIINQFEARGCAYKPHSISNGQVYVGNYLMLDKSGNPFTVLETTYKGQLQKSYNVNPRTIGFYNIDELSQIGLVEEIDSFEISIPKKVDIEDIFENQEIRDHQLIKVFRVRIGDVIDSVIYHNIDLAVNTGSKLYNVYLAEKELREKPKNLDDIFEDTLQSEIKSMSINYDEPHIAERV